LESARRKSRVTSGHLENPLSDWRTNFAIYVSNLEWRKLTPKMATYKKFKGKMEKNLTDNKVNILRIRGNLGRY